MSCMRHSNREPEFVQVTLRRPSLDFIPTAHSSPKLRLNFDDNNSLMGDTAIKQIMDKDNNDGSPTDQEQHKASPLLPPSPLVTGNYPGYRRGVVYHCGDRSTTYQTPSKSGGIPEIQERMSSLRFQPRSTDFTSTGHAVSDDYTKPTSLTVPVTPEASESNERRRPRPISVVPRFGTLTALPGSTMITEAETGTMGNNESSGPNMATTTNTMPPPPLPQASLPNPPHSAPVTMTTDRKRKLSMSAPFIKNVKRLMTPSSTKKPTITHTTHEATAMNRDASGIGGAGRSTNNPDTSNKDSKLQFVDAIRNPPAQHNEPHTPSRPSTSYPSTPKPSGGSLFNPFRHRRNITASSAHSTASGMSTIPAPEKTSKSGMNKTIIGLRSENNDLELQKRVLEDQIAIVRKDWIEASQELDRERMKSWQSEMERYHLGVKVEEQKARIRELEALVEAARAGARGE